MSDVDKDKIKDIYTGPDRRRNNRRKGPRREEIRFEPDKDDRRQEKGRRENDKSIWDKSKI